MMRFWRVRPRIWRGVKSLGMGWERGWGLEAVPLGGDWRGVK